MQEEHDADQRNDDALLDQRVLEGIDGGIDQVRAVVDRHDLDGFRQAARDLLEALFDVLDHVERVDAEALQHDAAGDLALAIQFGDAAPFVRTELDAGNVTQQHRRAAIGLEHDVAEVVDARQIALAANDIFELRKFDLAPAVVGIAGTDSIQHTLHSDAEVSLPSGVEYDDVL